MKKTLFVALLLLICLGIKGQENTTKSIVRKHYTIQKTPIKPKVDGFLDDKVWEDVPLATNFTERSPENGNPAPKDFKTEVKLLYNDSGIYVGAMLYDLQPKLIKRELTERDRIGNDDVFFITFNGYNDKQQSFAFFLTAAGVQIDAKISDNEEDFSWNAIWSSKTQIVHNGWSLEMFIPYSELRFPKEKVQEWGMNIGRDVRRTRTQYSWNHIDNKNNSYTLFDGVLKGIENIKPPVRLSFYPYASSYINTYKGKTSTNINGGMDVKYGLNEAFTLDMTLIPDFGQANFDRKVLNLGPFEQQFNEQRAFFNEGIDLFTKGYLFYSRRIGGAPSKRPTLQKNETLLDAPSKVKLLNATKISGRTSKGLGIGVFHSITAKTKATIKDNLTGKIRNETIEPLANYNVIALNQRFKGNSSISLVNTHVLRNKNFRNSNVTGIYWDIRNKKNKYYYYGGIEGSYVYGNQDKFGTEIRYGASKISGKSRFGISSNIRTSDYDINDLGFTGGTNYQDYNAWYQYKILQPQGIFNSYRLNVSTNYSRRLQPDLYRYFNMNTSVSFTTKEFLSFGGGIGLTPNGENDIYEPRQNGKFLKTPSSYNSNLWISTDFRKRLAFNFSINQGTYFQSQRNNFSINISPKIRISDRWNINMSSSAKWNNKDIGFVTKRDNKTVMGERDVFTLENNISSNYTFNPTTSLRLSIRHYASSVNYLNFYHLLDSGNLELRDFINGQKNTYNSWNMDARFSWWFAPGSQLTLLYRNSIDDFQTQHRVNYKDNLNRIISIPKINNISLRVVYFIDYNKIKKLMNKKHR